MLRIKAQKRQCCNFKV